MSKIFSTDHKVIGIPFLFTSLFLMLFGGLLAMLMRWQLGWPGSPLSFMEKIALRGCLAGSWCQSITTCSLRCTDRS